VLLAGVALAAGAEYTSLGPTGPGAPGSPFWPLRAWAADA
jgi:hypothetical protein